MLLARRLFALCVASSVLLGAQSRQSASQRARVSISRFTAGQASQRLASKPERDVAGLVNFLRCGIARLWSADSSATRTLTHTSAFL